MARSTRHQATARRATRGQPDVLLDSAACQPSQPYSSDASVAVLPDGALGSCYYFVDFPCGTNYLTGTGPTACYLYLKECANICTLDGGFSDCLYLQDAGCVDGSLTAQAGRPATIACGTCNGVGRRPAGLLEAEAKLAATPLGAYFAHSCRPRRCAQPDCRARARRAPLLPPYQRSGREVFVRRARDAGAFLGNGPGFG
jgi:hypothetical protein